MGMCNLGQGSLELVDAAGMPGMTQPPVNEIVAVALVFQGRRKLVRHLSSTLVGDIIKLHPSALQNSNSRQPLVIVDRQGFEIGREMPLGLVARQLGISVANGGLRELTLQSDEWGG